MRLRAPGLGDRTQNSDVGLREDDFIGHLFGNSGLCLIFLPFYRKRLLALGLDDDGTLICDRRNGSGDDFDFWRP